MTIALSQSRSITIPLDEQAHQLARSFAAEQANSEHPEQGFLKGKRVYLNTLAVYAAHTYFKWIQIDANLEESYSWHPIARACTNHCDLFLPDIGRVECCPVLPGETEFEPPDLSEDSVVYLAVQFKEELTDIELVGYRPIGDPEDPPETIDLEDDLFPIEHLLDYLFRIQAGRDFLAGGDHPIAQAARSWLGDRSLVSVIVCLERIVDAKYRWGVEGSNILRGGDRQALELVTKGRGALGSPGTDASSEEEEENLRRLAIDLMTELKALWEEN